MWLGNMVTVTEDDWKNWDDEHHTKLLLYTGILRSSQLRKALYNFCYFSALIYIFMFIYISHAIELYNTIIYCNNITV